MKTLILTKPWSYVTPEKTVDYTSGMHEVSDAIFAAAVAEGAANEEKADGNGTAKAGAPGTTGKA